MYDISLKSIIESAEDGFKPDFFNNIDLDPSFDPDVDSLLYKVVMTTKSIDTTYDI